MFYLLNKYWILTFMLLIYSKYVIAQIKIIFIITAKFSFSK